MSLTPNLISTKFLCQDLDISVSPHSSLIINTDVTLRNPGHELYKSDFSSSPFSSHASAVSLNYQGAWYHSLTSPLMHLSKLADAELRNFGLLTCCAAYLRENVTRRSHTIGTVLYPESFTVRELRHTLHVYLSMHLHGREVNVSLMDAIVASLEFQNLFYNVSWKDVAVADGDDICVFLYCDEEEQPPRGVFPPLAKCYSPTCGETGFCYSPSCPNRTQRCSTRIPSSNIIPKCYSPTCDQSLGCYSSTCPYRYSEPLDDQITEPPIHGSPISSNGPSTPTNEPPISCGDHYRPCIDRPRRSFSAYLLGFSAEEAFNDFWIGTPGVQ